MFGLKRLFIEKYAFTFQCIDKTHCFETSHEETRFQRTCKYGIINSYQRIEISLLSLSKPAKNPSRSRWIKPSYGKFYST